jgi:thiamine biosynthesis protein ThiI
MMDKQEIIDYAVSIGTFDTSILPFEDCCTLFVPKSPATNPNLTLVERVEAHLGEELERLTDEAVEGTETVLLTETGMSGASKQREDEWF